MSNDDKVFVERTQFTEYEGKLVAEASDLGIAPGYWPAEILITEADGSVQTFVEHPLHPLTRHPADGPIHHYCNVTTGIEMVLYND